MKNFFENIFDVSSIIRSGFFIYQTAKFFSNNRYYYTPYNYRLEKILPKIISTKINNSAFALQISSNNPIEDRYTLKKFTLENSNNALFMSVFDGHGGFSLSEYANNNIFNYFINAYNKLPKYLNEDDKIKNALLNSFYRIENEFYNISYEKYLSGEGREATLGTCALIGIIFNNKLYIANLGDSKARMFSIYENDNKRYLVNKLTKVFNARKKYEQDRLINLWPHDKNIFKCHKNNPKACYVKGRLQPTRTLGDFHLKFQEFNEHIQTNDNKNKYKKEIVDFEGPYINFVPEINVYQLNDKDKYILLASDGLWDFLKSSEVSKLIKQYEKKRKFNNVENISYKLLDNVLFKASEEANLSFNQMIQIPEGKLLRKIHDDITMILCSLDKIKF